MKYPKWLKSLPAVVAVYTGHTSVYVVSPFTATETNQLNFGSVAVPGTTSVVRVTPAGIRSIISGKIELVEGNNPYVESPGQFLLTGVPERPWNITLADSSVVLKGPGADITVDNFQFPTSGTLDSMGNTTISIGADLTLNPNQAEGAYTGTYYILANSQ